MTTFFLHIDDESCVASADQPRCDYYVYVLIDPRNDQPFYVGKGCGDRAKQHLYENEKKTENLFKFNKIQKIKNLGLTVTITYIETDLTQDAAYDLECKLIRQYGRAKIDPDGILTNICADNRPPKNTREVTIRASNAGKTRSEETASCISASKKGQPWTEARRIAQINKTNKNNNL